MECQQQVRGLGKPRCGCRPARVAADLLARSLSTTRPRSLGFERLAVRQAAAAAGDHAEPHAVR